MEASTTAYSVTTEASAYFRTGILDLPAHSHGRALVGIMTLKALGYFAPILVGAILVVFMVKPLFARTR